MVTDAIATDTAETLAEGAGDKVELVGHAGLFNQSLPGNSRPTGYASTGSDLVECAD